MPRSASTEPCRLLPAGMWPLGDDESQKEMLNVGNVPAVPGAARSPAVPAQAQPGDSPAAPGDRSWSLELGSIGSCDLPRSTLFLIAWIRRNVIFVLAFLSQGCWRLGQGGARLRAPAGPCPCLPANLGCPGTCWSAQQSGMCLAELSVCLSVRSCLCCGLPGGCDGRGDDLSWALCSVPWV